LIETFLTSASAFAPIAASLSIELAEIRISWFAW
jgi:hypothetical protein